MVGMSRTGPIVFEATMQSVPPSVEMDLARVAVP